VAKCVFTINGVRLIGEIGSVGSSAKPTCKLLPRKRKQPTADVRLNSECQEGTDTLRLNPVTTIATKLPFVRQGTAQAVQTDKSGSTNSNAIGIAGNAESARRAALEGALCNSKK
jgi:hypothetical protein